MYGCPFGDFKKMMDSELEELRKAAEIKDDTVCQEANLDLFLVKILNHIQGESITADNYKDEHGKTQYVNIVLDTRGHKMMLVMGDMWRRVRKFLELDSQTEVMCPICLEQVNEMSNKRVVCCNVCCTGVCMDCSLKQFIANQGLVVCCNCRHTTGMRMPDHLVMEKVRRILFSMQMD
jgi:hypothetical protein